MMRLFYQVICLLLFSCTCWAAEAIHYADFFETHPFKHSFDQAIAKIAGQHFQKEKMTLSRLSGGMTSTEVFLFHINSHQYVLRTLNPKYDMESRKNEIIAHTFAAHLNIAPNLIYVDENLEFIIMPFIQGHMLSPKDLKNKKILLKIAEQLAQLHRYSGPFNQNKPQIARAQKHYERAQQKEIALPSIYPKLYQHYYQEGLELNNDKEEWVLCHADLNSANIIIAGDGSIYFIDWTSATWDNKYTDLGYFSLINGLNDEETKLFFSAYIGSEPKQNQWKKLKQAQKRTSFLTATVWFDFSESEKDKQIPLQERIQKLDQLLKNPNLKTGKEYVMLHQVIAPNSEKTQDIQLYALGFLKTYIEWKN